MTLTYAGKGQEYAVISVSHPEKKNAFSGRLYVSVYKVIEDEMLLNWEIYLVGWQVNSSSYTGSMCIELYDRIQEIVSDKKSKAVILRGLNG